MNTFVCRWRCVRVYLCDENTHLSISCVCVHRVCVHVWRGEEVYVCGKVREREGERQRKREAWPTFGKAHRMKLPNITPELLNAEPHDWLLLAPAWQQHWHHPGGGGREREGKRGRGGHGEDSHTLNPKEESNWCSNRKRQRVRKTL